MLTRTPQDPCPSRHPQPVIGTCSLCRKQVCDACAGLKTREKIICKFCFADLKEHDKPKAPPSLYAKFRTFLGFGGPRAVKLEACTGGAHLQESIGSCQVCKKSICPACTSEKKLSGQPVCAGCFQDLFQIRDQVKIEEQKRFAGGVKGLVNFCLFVTAAALVILLVFSCLTAGVMTVFNLLYPASFVTFGQHWRAGEYGTMVRQDVPDLYYEIYERIWYEWWYEEGLRMSYEQWKQEQREAAGQAPPAPDKDR